MTETPPRRNMGPGSQTWSGIKQRSPLWTEWLTHTCENITLPQTSFAVGKMTWPSITVIVEDEDETSLNVFRKKLDILRVGLKTISWFQWHLLMEKIPTLTDAFGLRPVCVTHTCYFQFTKSMRAIFVMLHGLCREAEWMVFSFNRSMSHDILTKYFERLNTSREQRNKVEISLRGKV